MVWCGKLDCASTEGNCTEFEEKYRYWRQKFIEKMDIKKHQEVSQIKRLHNLEAFICLLLGTLVAPR